MSQSILHLYNKVEGLTMINKGTNVEVFNDKISGLLREASLSAVTGNAQETSKTLAKIRAAGRRHNIPISAETEREIGKIRSVAYKTLVDSMVSEVLQGMDSSKVPHPSSIARARHLIENTYAQHIIGGVSSETYTALENAHTASYQHTFRRELSEFLGKPDHTYDNATLHWRHEIEELQAGSGLTMSSDESSKFIEIGRRTSENLIGVNKDLAEKAAKEGDRAEVRKFVDRVYTHHRLAGVKISDEEKTRLEALVGATTVQEPYDPNAKLLRAMGMQTKAS